ncbi:MAG: hypothetical protein Rsou_1259 [Candidatus Ruthia sp. Asou_11_S2]|nr:hypothetical protein [Candidatus Ruthia sp. Asou_11_S2]
MSAMNSPCPAPISVVRKITENSGCIKSPYQLVTSSSDGAFLSMLKCSFLSGLSDLSSSSWWMVSFDLRRGK